MMLAMARAASVVAVLLLLVVSCGQVGRRPSAQPPDTGEVTVLVDNRSSCDAWLHQVIDGVSQGRIGRVSAFERAVFRARPYRPGEALRVGIEPFACPGYGRVVLDAVYAVEGQAVAVVITSHIPASYAVVR